MVSFKIGQFAILEPASWLPAISVSWAVSFHLVPTAMLSGHRYCLIFTNTLRLEFCNGHDRDSGLVSLVSSLHVTCPVACDLLWPHILFSHPSAVVYSHIPDRLSQSGRRAAVWLVCSRAAPASPSSRDSSFATSSVCLAASYTVCFSDYLFLSLYRYYTRKSFLKSDNIGGGGSPIFCGWRDDLAVKRTFCPCTGPECNSQHP